MSLSKGRNATDLGSNAVLDQPANHDDFPVFGQDGAFQGAFIGNQIG